MTKGQNKVCYTTNYVMDQTTPGFSDLLELEMEKNNKFEGTRVAFSSFFPGKTMESSRAAPRWQALQCSVYRTHLVMLFGP